MDNELMIANAALQVQRAGDAWLELAHRIGRLVDDYEQGRDVPSAPADPTRCPYCSSAWDPSHDSVCPSHPLRFGPLDPAAKTSSTEEPLLTPNVGKGSQAEGQSDADLYCEHEYWSDWHAVCEGCGSTKTRSPDGLRSGTRPAHWDADTEETDYHLNPNGTRCYCGNATASHGWSGRTVPGVDDNPHEHTWGPWSHDEDNPGWFSHECACGKTERQNKTNLPADDAGTERCGESLPLGSSATCGLDRGHSGEHKQFRLLQRKVAFEADDDVSHAHPRRRILWNEAERKTIDEFVVHDATIHLEQMDDNCYWIGITDADGREFSVNLHTPRATIRCTQQDCEWMWDEDATHEPHKPGGESVKAVGSAGDDA